MCEEAQFVRGGREFVAKLRIGAAKLARDAVERGIGGQAGLGADDKQVERVGKALADRVRALGDQVLHVEIRGLVRQDQRTCGDPALLHRRPVTRSEEHTSELQSLMRISYAVFCLKKKTTKCSRQELQEN